MLPTFTVSEPGPQFTPAQLGFVAVVALALYAAFVLTQTKRHREFFLPVSTSGEAIDGNEHAPTPSLEATMLSLGLLLVSLIAVVGLAKAVSPALEAGVEAAGIPNSFVGVVIAMLVLLPEGIAASRAALQNRIQTSLNLAFGSAMASIGLTIPVIAVVSIWLPGPLTLGLGPLQIVLLVLTVAVATLTVIPGRRPGCRGSCISSSSRRSFFWRSVPESGCGRSIRHLTGGSQKTSILRVCALPCAPVVPESTTEFTSTPLIHVGPFNTTPTAYLPANQNPFPVCSVPPSGPVKATQQHLSPCSTYKE